MKLVVVESPSKAKKIRELLGSGYRVAASMGHVRDLPAKGALAVAFKDGKVLPSYEPLEALIGSRLPTFKRPSTIRWARSPRDRARRGAWSCAAPRGGPLVHEVQLVPSGPTSIPAKGRPLGHGLAQ